MDLDFTNNFNTALTPQEEADYKLWLVSQSQARGRDMSQDNYDYDMRGYFKAGSGLDGVEGHFPDTFKKPNHPTFSNESVYHGVGDGRGGRYVGGAWSNKDGVDHYQPSNEMLSVTHNPDFLADYFKRVEPNARLILPASKTK